MHIHSAKQTFIKNLLTYYMELLYESIYSEMRICMLMMTLAG